MPKLKNNFTILPYDPNWAREFVCIRDFLLGVIGNLVLEIQHVGSTSVPGLCAKPIIDIVAVIESYAVFPQIAARLAAVGFEHEGDLGVPEREAFRRLTPDDFMDYHFYVCPKDSENSRRHSRFNKALLKNPEIAKAYGELKTRLMMEANGDRAWYTDAKTEFIVDVMNRVDDEGNLLR